MRLWQKIFLICSLILTVSVGLCSAIQLAQTRESILNSAYGQAEKKQQALARSFSEMVRYYSSDDDSAAAQKALIHYCFSRFADASSILMWQGERIYGQASAPLEEYLYLDADVSLHEAELDGQQMLIVGSEISFRFSPEKPCQVYVLENISSVYNELDQMVLKFVLISIFAAALGLLFIAVLVRRSIMPLEKLKETAFQISQGDYSKRADIKSRDEIGSLALSFNTMAASVERHIQELTETAQRQKLLIGAVSHELKTPLTGMLLNVDTLQNTYLTENEQLEMLGDIEAQAKWLEHLSQKMLKLLAIGSNVEMTPVDVGRLLEQLKMSAQPMLAKRGLTLEIQNEADEIFADGDLLLSALINLVDNGAKASEKGQTIIAQAYDNVIEIKDRGCGISSEALAHITEPFYMADSSRSKQNGGAGLGLAIVKAALEAHGAELHIDSALGQGSTFKIIFPGN